MSFNTNFPAMFVQWLANELVTDNIMTNFTEDIYNKFAALTDHVSPCVLSGANITSYTSSSVTISAGLIRGNDLNETFLPHNPTAAFFTIPLTTLTGLSGIGYIVAQIEITPESSGNTIYLFEGNVQYLENGIGFDPNTMVILGRFDSTPLFSSPNVSLDLRVNDFYNLQTLLSQHAILFIEGNYSLGDENYQVVIASTVGVAININLPDIDGTDIDLYGLPYSITNCSQLHATVTSINGKLINGMTNYIITSGSSISIKYIANINQWVLI